MSGEKKFTFEELKALNKKDNLHLVIQGKVYAVTKFLDEHPGGDEVLLGEAGRDATEAFEDVGHSDEARDLLKQYLVGVCDEAAPKGPSTAKASASTTQAAKTTQAGFDFSYLLPLGLLGAYLAYRFYFS